MKNVLLAAVVILPLVGCSQIATVDNNCDDQVTSQIAANGLPDIVDFYDYGMEQGSTVLEWHDARIKSILTSVGDVCLTAQFNY